MSYEWVNNYIGIPYVRNGRNLDGLDCWGLIWLVKREIENMLLPDWTVASARYHTVVSVMSKAVNEVIGGGGAKRVDKPKDFDIIVLRRGDLCAHVGLYINKGILHSDPEMKSSTFEPLSRYMVRGNSDLEYYRWLS